MEHKYIDTNASLAEFMEAVYGILDDDDTNDRANDIIDVFCTLPDADVEPVRHGHWINTHDRLVKCSLCGKSVQTNWRGFYCQNCGAKMDGGAEDEERK